jgi:hypothetical protein
MPGPHDRLLQKISSLPSARITEVKDFVDFLTERERDSDRQLARAAAAGSEPAFAKVWDNPEDDVYDACDLPDRELQCSLRSARSGQTST